VSAGRFRSKWLCIHDPYGVAFAVEVRRHPACEVRQGAELGIKLDGRTADTSSLLSRQAPWSFVRKRMKPLPALVGFDASFEIGLAGSRGDLTRDDGGVLDAAKFRLKGGSDDVLEGTLAVDLPKQHELAPCGTEQTSAQ
jgi:hypothetical protein